MKNLKIFLLFFCLLFLLFHLNILEAKAASEKCKVTIKVENDSCSFLVDKGTNKVTRIIQDHIGELEVPIGKTIESWDCSKCKVDNNGCIVDTSCIIAILITQEAALQKQDSAFWIRNQSFLKKQINATLVPNGLTKISWQTILPYVALLLSMVSPLLLLLLNRKNKNEFRDDVIDIVRDSRRLKEWRDEVKSSSVISASSNISADSMNRDLQRRVAELEDALGKKHNLGDTTALSTAVQNVPKSTVVSQKILYADSIVDGKFTRVKESPGEDSIFELMLKGDSHASVTIHKPAHKKVLANHSYLEGCEKQLIGRSTVSIEREGEAQKNDNGKWIVKTPLKVVVS